MRHGIYRVTAFEITSPYTLRVEFDDGTIQVFDFRVGGGLHGPLRDLDLFNSVQLDPEVGTLVWPNGADFDSANLHDWPHVVDELTSVARRWRNHDRKRDTG